MRPAAVLFDCDGVLADSEALANAIVAEHLSARGWRISAEQARETFVGMSIRDMTRIIEQRLGVLPSGWVHDLSARVAEVLSREAAPIPGAIAAVHAVLAAGIPAACASNSGREELAGKLRRLGLSEAFGGRVFSFEDVPRPKPAPDIYRAAAAACGAEPAACVVVEDSVLGVRAGIAAGCRVLGFARETDAAALAAIGAEPFHDMAELPRLLGLDRAGGALPERAAGC